MKASLYTFVIGLRDLRNYIKDMELEYQVLFSKRGEKIPFDHEAPSIEHRVSSSIVKWKMFNYNCIIISLYGYFEQYIESLLESYIKNISKMAPRYSDIPEPIKNNQIDLSIKLLNVIDQSKYRDIITKAQVISNLHSCINNHENYCINAEAFSYHAANIRRNIIQDIFNQIGIKDVPNKVHKTASFIRYLSSKAHGTDPVDEADLSYIDNLADRRNDVAHGVPVDDILSTEWLLDYINFFEAFGSALNEILYSNLLKFELKKSAIYLGRPIEVYGNHIVCITACNKNIKVDDLLVAVIDNETSPHRWGRILEIQINKIRYMELMNCLNKIDVALRVDFKAKDSYSYYLLKKGDNITPSII